MKKMVINDAFGGYGYGVAEQFAELVEYYEDDRFAPELVQFVENHPKECGDLTVIEIPDDFTDYYIEEYDGLESVLYVEDGLIYRAEES